MRNTVLTPTLLSHDKPQYLQQSQKYLPLKCPRCFVENHLILDGEDPSYAYCWAHFGEVFIGVAHDQTEKGYNHFIGPNLNSKLVRNGASSKRTREGSHQVHTK
jgi:hypothetical protein